jgi:hypothetical protein
MEPRIKSINVLIDPIDIEEFTTSLPSHFTYILVACNSTREPHINITCKNTSLSGSLTASSRLFRTARSLQIIDVFCGGRAEKGPTYTRIWQAVGVDEVQCDIIHHLPKPFLDLSVADP